jgi:hypothetical protein
MGWGWDKGVGRYRDQDTGRFLPVDQVRQWANESVAASEDAAGQLAKMAADGSLRASEINDSFRASIKSEYIRQYLVGIGGEGQMTKADWGSIGGMLKEQYGHLDDFTKEIAAGNLTEAQIRTRMDMYINSAREGYERAQAKVAKGTNKTEEKWVFGDSVHCPGCEDYESEGWQPIGTFPPPGSGSTPCLTSCKCHKEYR